MQNRKYPYLIIGNGRLAKHFKHYFDLLGVNYLNWHRQTGESLDLILPVADKLLVLISDSQIVPFIEDHSSMVKEDQIWIHCSGMLETELAESAHPLMTFSNELYSIDTYKSIPFITAKNRLSFIELFPELPNDSYSIESDNKLLYHTWAVMSGNFVSILWMEYFKVLKDKFGLPPKVAWPYLNQIKENIFNDTDPLTGPISRGDFVTIEKHLEMLADDNFHKVYKAFIETQNKSKASGTQDE